MASREKIIEVVVRPLQEIARQIFGRCPDCGQPPQSVEEQWAAHRCSSDDAMNELKMYHSEAVEWISALEYWIRQQGLEVPTWLDVEQAGWHKEMAHPGDLN